jgi:uncharacterized membrane protein YhaH (DUF805 family)
MDWGKLLTSPRGRIGRQSYWLFIGLNIGLSTAAMVLDGVLLARPDDGPLGRLVNLAAIYAWICIIAKRLHDLGLSGWWQALGYATLVAAGVLMMLRTGDELLSNLLALLLALVPLTILGAAKGQAGPNRFGEPNSGDRAAAPTAEVFS